MFSNKVLPYLYNHFHLHSYATRSGSFWWYWYSITSTIITIWLLSKTHVWSTIRHTFELGSNQLTGNQPERMISAPSNNASFYGQDINDTFALSSPRHFWHLIFTASLLSCFLRLEGYYTYMDIILDNT